MDKELKEEIDKFARRIVCGEELDSPEDMQFYLNYKEEIETVLKEWSNLN
jgi:hypothetical protein